MIVAQQADGIIVIDTAGSMQFVNPAAERLLGRSATQLIGQIFGFAEIGHEPSQIHVMRSDGTLAIAEIRTVATSWNDAPAQLVSLHDITAQHQMQARLRDAEAFNRTILDSLVSHIAVVDAEGTIVAVNRAWRTFASENGDPDMLHTGEGSNYFAACAHASSGEARAVLAGAQAVLAAQLPCFELEYPCDSPSGERWFLMRVEPLRSQQRPGLVISHTDITEQRRDARLAADAETLRAQLQSLERELIMIGADRPAGPRPAEALRRRDPAFFQAFVGRYMDLLDLALDQRSFKGRPAELPIRAIAEQLGALGASARDVVELHLAGVRARSAGAAPPRQQAYLEEGRILVLELMGHLAEHYRWRGGL